MSEMGAEPPRSDVWSEAAEEGQLDAPVADAVRRGLSTLGATYTVVACDEKLSESDAFAAAYGYRPEEVANTVVVKVRAGGTVSYGACLALSSTRLDLNRRLRQHLGARKISFASPEETLSLTGMEIGSVGPVGLPETMPIYVDRRALDQPRLIVGSGFRRSKIWLQTDTLERLPLAQVLADLAVEPEREPE